MSALWLVRHAPVVAAPGLCYGIRDLAVDTGETRMAAERLAEQLPHGISVSCSPLQRCELLALDLIGLRADLTYKIDERLREADFGHWEGMPWADIPRAEFDAWMADFADARPGGQGETVRELMARVGAAWDEHHARGKPAVWITHAGVMRAALLLSRGVRLPTTAGDWPIDALAFGAALRLNG